ncbi:hypothetical protein B0H10DRAFT_2122947, partial [Mycena sp. CBHHK59/15]
MCPCVPSSPRNSMAHRRLSLHPSALSDAEHALFTASLADLAEVPHSTIDWDQVSVSVREARAWLCGRYAALGAGTVDEILRLFAPATALVGGAFFAALRLIQHAQAGRPVDRGLALSRAPPPQPSPPPRRGTTRSCRRPPRPPRRAHAHRCPRASRLPSRNRLQHPPRLPRPRPPPRQPPRPPPPRLALRVLLARAAALLSADAPPTARVHEDACVPVSAESQPVHCGPPPTAAPAPRVDVRPRVAVPVQLTLTVRLPPVPVPFHALPRLRRRAHALVRRRRRARALIRARGSCGIRVAGLGG